MGGMSIQLWNSVRSDALDMNTSVVVANPMAPNPSDPSRLLILLHGLTGNYMTWTMRSDVQALADQYNLTIAMPDGQRSFWIDERYGLRWGAWVGHELPQLLATVLRLSSAKPLIGGLSMGGYGAVRAAFDYPATFAAAFSLSGTLDVAEPAFRGRHPDLYEIGFGNSAAPRIEDNLIARLSPEAGPLAVTAPPPIYATCGTGDRLLEQNRKFAAAMDEAGHALDYSEAPGDHNFIFWNRQLPKALNWATA